MTSTEVKLEYSIAFEAESHKKVQAIIVAAGSSSRMNGINKLFAPIFGIPVIVRSLLAFETCSQISSIVVVARGCDIPSIQRLTDEYHITKLCAITEGGETRHQSVTNGLVQCDSDSEYIAIHDAARPLVKLQTINNVIDAAVRFKAATCAVRVKDTIKLTNENAVIESTPDRSKLWAVQTPQVFDASLYRRAVEQAAADNTEYTDDCALCEHICVPVHIVEGAYSNIKITTPEDIAVAEALYLYESGQNK